MSNEEIVKELNKIKKELSYIKAHMVDVDTVLTADEEMRLNESIAEYKAGKVISLEELKANRELKK